MHTRKGSGTSKVNLEDRLMLSSPASSSSSFFSPMFHASSSPRLLSKRATLVETKVGHVSESTPQLEVNRADGDLWMFWTCGPKRLDAQGNAMLPK